MIFTLWFLVAGGLLVFMALAASMLKRLPLTASMLYLALGLALAPAGLLRLDLLEHAELLERITEVVLIISVFTAGLKLRTPLSDGRWRLPARLAAISLALTVGMVALVGVFALGLPLGAAILLGAILAPTDPVLAADVQIENPSDQDQLRFSLTGEAGLNDGTAFPFVVLGLGLLGLDELGELGWRWLAEDLAWGIGGGLAIGGLLGALIGHLVLYLRREHKEAVGLDDFLALGLMALSYGAALLLRTDGLLAVFAAGLALRRIERRSNGTTPPEDVETTAREGEKEEIATDPEKAPAYMAQAVLGFNEQLERIGIVVVVVLVGGLLSARAVPAEALWFVPLLLLVIRPVAVFLGLIRSPTSPTQRRLIAWFGIRGVGPIYYLTYALHRGLPPDLAERLAGLTLTVVAASIVVHGISVTPLMRRYSRRHEAVEPAPSEG